MLTSLPSRLFAVRAPSLRLLSASAASLDTTTVEAPLKVWKVSPFDKARPLYERNAREVYKNLLHLTADGRTTRISIYHRLLFK